MGMAKDTFGPYRDQSYTMVDEQYVSKQRFCELFESFATQWMTPNDIVERFRLLNQLFVEYKLNKIVKNNILDLEFVAKILRFYHSVEGNGSSVFKELCNDENTIHDTLSFDDEQNNNEFAVTFKSPMIVLRKQIKYVMEFVNTFDDKRRHLRCSLAVLFNELKERKVIASDEEFANLKALIDRSQFSISTTHI